VAIVVCLCVQRVQ